MNVILSHVPHLATRSGHNHVTGYAGTLCTVRFLPLNVKTFVTDFGSKPPKSDLVLEYTKAGEEDTT